MAMGDDEEPVQHCQLDAPVDIPQTLAAAGIEYLDVDDTRTVVIYRSGILMVTATDGHASAARAFDVELWEPPMEDTNRDPADFFTTFIDEVVATTDASHQ
jgi:hypothetical protein